jgi:hypothetical protein
MRKIKGKQTFCSEASKSFRDAKTLMRKTENEQLLAGFLLASNIYQ